MASLAPEPGTTQTYIWRDTPTMAEIADTLPVTVELKSEHSVEGGGYFVRFSNPSFAWKLLPLEMSEVMKHYFYLSKVGRKRYDIKSSKLPLYDIYLYMLVFDPRSVIFRTSCGTNSAISVQ